MVGLLVPNTSPPMKFIVGLMVMILLHLRAGIIELVLMVVPNLLTIMVDVL